MWLIKALTFILQSVSTYRSLIKPHISPVMTAISNKAAPVSPLWSSLIDWTLLENPRSAGFQQDLEFPIYCSHKGKSFHRCLPFVCNELASEIFKELSLLKFDMLLSVHLYILNNDSVKEPLYFALTCRGNTLNHEC